MSEIVGSMSFVTCGADAILVPMTRRIGLIGYDDLTVLDMVGPMEAFHHVAEELGSRADAYELIVLAATSRPFTSSSGLRVVPHTTLGRAPELDTILVPGGRGLREPATNAHVAAWLAERAPRTRRVATVCTGIYGLAPTGLLDGRRVTTHWRFARDLAHKFPALRVEPNLLFIRDGQFITSAGVTAGIDLSLALIEEDHGPAMALAVARELVVYMQRAGGQEQYSEPLMFQAESRDALADVAAWMASHLRGDLSVAALARRASLSPRQFARRFKAAYGATPAELVERLRLDEARRRLSERTATIEQVAASVGYTSSDAFRRAFERRFGIAPRNYRSSFRVVSGAPLARGAGARRGG
jgi:transcriptional regulator GlxA family with amidase domain